MPVFVIGVSGATCSGKTQICKKLMASGKYDCEIISMDDFYYPYNSDKHVRLPEFDNYANYEVIESVDWPALARAVRVKIEQLEEAADSGPCQPVRLLLVEGILVLNCAAVDQRCHLRVFIQLDHELEFLRRRRIRVYQDDPVPVGYDAAVTWPMYVLNSAALTGRGDVTCLDGADSPEELYRQFCDLLRALVAD